jgi:mono/diheme cytochrome c family protein
MMYVKSPAQIETFIRDGSAEGGPEKDRGGYGAAPKAKPDAPFHMRGFGDRLGRREIADLAAYVLAADGYLVPSDGPVADGAALSVKFGCEGCHGVAGSGGRPNPRSFTGTVPGWTGQAFEHLVSGEPEFREWVLRGRSRRMAASRAASFFLDRANLYMPSFQGTLTDGDVADLWAYVRWLRTTARGAGTGDRPAAKE